MINNKIDFVIPCHKKDFQSLKLVVNGIKDNISRVNKIFVISKDNPEIDNVIHISENLYSSYITKEFIEDVWKFKNPMLSYRAKWIYQQFLKLLSAKIIKDITETYVIVDSDTIFLNDISFDSTKFYYCKAQEYHKPYLNPIKKLLKCEDTIGFSTICHHMMFNKNILNEMIFVIEKNFNFKPFVNCILDILDYNEASCLSEWDLYANYVILKYPKICTNRQLKWKDIPFIPSEFDLNLLKQNYDFVSCHAYMRGIE